MKKAPYMASGKRIKSGLTSITFRELAPRKIVDMAATAHLDGIEWGGDIHVPHGDLKRAAEIGRMTRDAGLAVAAYGSYYRVGESAKNGLGFANVLDTAMALDAPLVRVWVGNQSPESTDADTYKAIIADSQHIADMAASEGLSVAFEFHGGTLTETAESTLDLLGAADRSGLATLWQPPVGMDTDGCMASLRCVLPMVRNVHVFHWGAGGFEDRRPLAEGAARWRKLMELLAGTGRTHYALLEYVANDAPESFRQDAATLRELVGATI